MAHNEKVQLLKLNQEVKIENLVNETCGEKFLPTLSFLSVGTLRFK